MSFLKSVASKRRAIVDQAITADGGVPTFPTGPTNGVLLFLGDFKGAKISGFQFTCGALSGGTISALDCTIEHSPDGTNWHTLKALTQATGAGVTSTDLDDSDPEPYRFLRANFTATGNYGSAAGVKIEVIFAQCGPRGEYSPPGKIDQNG